MANIRNLLRYKQNINAALVAFALLVSKSLQSEDLVVDITPQSAAQIAADQKHQSDHIKLAICRPDAAGNPYQFSSPKLLAAILTATGKHNAIVRRAKLKTPDILFDAESGFLHIAGAKIDKKAKTLLQVKAEKKAAANNPAAENETAPPAADDGEKNTTPNENKAAAENETAPPAEKTNKSNKKA